MKRLLLFALTFLSLQGFPQSNETIEWIDQNSILIEDADPDTELNAFKKAVPEKFENARIYGFGELSHDGKEFFNIKAKFFKYLVMNHGVKTFMIEDSFKAEAAINNWINNKTEDFAPVRESFTIGFWHSTEVYDLLHWMREYNAVHSTEDRIKFYTFDTQSAINLDKHTLQFIFEYDIPIEQDLIDNFKECQQKPMTWTATPGWTEDRTPKLVRLQEVINAFSASIDTLKSDKVNRVNRELNILMNYTRYVQEPTTAVRDKLMFDNAEWVIENELSNEKVFIWAHNEHINKRGMWSHNSGIKNMGSYLKTKYGEKYYSVGFDFGIGQLKGFDPKNPKNKGWRLYTVDKPYKKTYAETLFESEKDIYFIDMSVAEKTDPSQFFSSMNQNLAIGGMGFQPKPLHKIKMSKIYTDDYDALIFVREISPADNIIQVD